MNSNVTKAIGIAAMLLAGMQHARSQNVQTILADSVKITGTAGTGELILLNSTKDSTGFLWNKGGGRTAFRPLLRKVNDSVYISGTDSVKLALRKYLSFNQPDTIVGAKTFRPVINNSADTAAGTVFNPSFAVQNQDTVATADFGIVQVVNSANTRIYSAYFYDKVLVQDVMEFQLGMRTKITGELMLGTWGARFDNNPVSLVKPAGAFPEQFNFASHGQAVTTATFLKSGVGFKDSVVFTDGAQDYSFMKFSPVLTQQPGATGALRSVDVRVQLTGVKDFRGVQVDVNNINGYAIWSPGTAPAVLGGIARYQNNYRDSFSMRTLIDKNYADSVMSGSWQKGNANTLYKTTNIVIGRKPANTYPLSVEGTLLAKKAKVSADDIAWADYVFDSTYIPMPLPELQAYVKQYRHLPGMPSAAAVEREGLDVVESQNAMLKQIEELTLHLIRQHKKMEENGRELKQLRAVYVQ